MSINKYGLLVTLSVHLALASLLIYIGITTPAPPPPDLGILVNFGDGETGLGNTEPREAIQDVAIATPPPTSGNANENVINQDFEDAPVLKENKSTNQIKNNIPTENTKNTNTKPVEDKPKVPERTVNTRALYSGKNNGTSTGSEGVAGGKGNQGSKFGSVNSNNHSGDSRGSGGTTFSLAGRNPLKLPSPEYKNQIEGKVVVEITVDKQGKVTKAVAGVRGSTTLDERLLEAAEKAAMRANFDVSANAPAFQKGTITYHFILQ